VKLPRPGPLGVRFLLAAATYVGVLAGTEAFGLEPQPVLLALVVALIATGLWLLLDALDDATTPWRIEPLTVSAQVGRDARFDSFVRVIHGHLTAREPNPLLQERLTAVAQSVLEQRYGLVLEDPQARQLLGPAVMGMLQAPSHHRFSLSEIESFVTAIEEL